MIELLPSRAVAVSLFGWGIHWYGLLYVASFALAAIVLPRLQAYRGLSLSRDEWSSVLTASVLGVILGGRLGYVFLYEPVHYLANPLEIFAVWKGGMASHGGFIGVTIALLYVARKHRIAFLSLADLIVIPVAAGLALGRVGNFINQELYGTVTTLPWGMVFPGAEGLRHPVQLYAVAKDLLIASVCFWHLQNIRPVRPGRTAALFLMLYAVLRFLTEFVREPDHPVFMFGGSLLTRGQFFSLFVGAAGCVAWILLGRKRR